MAATNKQVLHMLYVMAGDQWTAALLMQSAPLEIHTGTDP